MRAVGDRATEPYALVSLSHARVLAGRRLGWHWRMPSRRWRSPSPSKIDSHRGHSRCAGSGTAELALGRHAAAAAAFDARPSVALAIDATLNSTTRRPAWHEWRWPEAMWRAPCWPWKACWPTWPSAARWRARRYRSSSG